MKKMSAVVLTGFLALSLSGCWDTTQVDAPGQEQVDKAKEVVKEIEDTNGILDDQINQ